MRLLVFLLSLCTLHFSNAQFAKYVNPFIGTGGTGHTFPGATTPFAMVQLSPDTRIDGSWDGCSGYHYSDSIIYGLSHTHLSGTGCSDYGDIAFMPYFSKNEIFESLKTKNISSKFSHKNEKASAGFYSVLLDDIPLKVELTATTRTGFQRYTFLEDGFGYIVLNLKHRDELLEGTITQINTSNYKGKRVSKAWAAKQELYYYFQTNKTPSKTEIVKDKQNDFLLIMQYAVRKGETILLKTGISATDDEGARLNLLKENIAWDFENVKLQAFNSWEKELKKIEVISPLSSTKELEQLEIFYTALYHCMIHPSIINDVDGRYKGRDGKIHTADGFNYYTVFSLWDTHRALHPLLNIIDKKRSHDFVITFLKQFEQSGRLPMWELWNNETDCMIGFHSVSVILDAYKKRVISEDELKQLWPAVKAEAMSSRFGLDKFREKGYLSVEDEHESVSKTLEYSYNMWCVSQIAKELHEQNDFLYFEKLQHGWQNVYNTTTQFVQPRKNGNWLSKFSPFEVNNHFTEANSWQYSFYSPHSNLLNYKKLEELFVTSSKTEGRNQADITGLIGQYAHGNEPSHSFIYLLNNINRSKYLQYVYNNFYTNKPNGLIGNEDCGQMSAWYIISALGFYQTCPGSNEFTVGLPIFNQIKINTENHSFSIKKEAINNSSQPYGIYSTNSNNNYFSHHFNYEMLENNSTIYITNNSKFRPVEKDEERKIVLVAPLIKSVSNGTFTDSTYIELEYNEKNNPTKNIQLFYSINNGNLIQYKQPFITKDACNIKAIATYKEDTSGYSLAKFHKRLHQYSIQLLTNYHKQYTADGDDGTINGQYGELDWRKGGWQGYQGQNFEAIIDMKSAKQCSEISANFLQDTRSWIVFPSKITFYASMDGKNFTLVETVYNKMDANNYTIEKQLFSIKPKQLSARYIKVIAYNFGKLPIWHESKGSDAYIFIDEIEIK